MNKLMKLIRENRAIFTSVLCPLSCVLFAPFAQAAAIEVKAMTADDKPVAEAPWADVREIMIDTRERIVVAYPEEILPIAYSTNGWGAVKGTVKAHMVFGDGTEETHVGSDGYDSWKPAIGAFGAYDTKQEWLTADNTPKGSASVTIYYSQPYALATAVDGSGKIDVEASTLEDGRVLGYDLVHVAAKPDAGMVFKGWSLTTNGVELADAFTNATTAVSAFAMPQADAVVLAQFERLPELVSFRTNEVAVTEGEIAYVIVNGGSAAKPTQVTVSLQKNTLTSYTPYYGTDAKGNAKRCSFPLVLNWDAGDTESKVIGISTKAVAKKEADKFLTLQLGSEANYGGVGTDVCTVTVKDAMEDPPEAAPYVRALAWPANGGTVSGFGVLSVSKKTGEISSTKTLTATAKKWATFAGWYKAMTNDATRIDLENGLVTTEKKLNVGRGTDFVCEEGATFFAYFTDVTPVAAVDVPDAAAPGSTGVSCEDGVYAGEVGIRFALPVSFQDETENGSLMISGLPSGLTYNKKTGCIEGVPTAVTEKTVKFVAKNAAGGQTATFAFDIGAMPPLAIGNFAGTVSDDADNGHRTGCGSVTFTAGKTGALSAKVTTRLSGSRSFSAKGYVRLDADTLLVAMTNATKEVFEATLSLKNGLYDTFVKGRAWGLDAEKRGSLACNDEGGVIVALRNAFLKADKNDEALAKLAEYKGTYGATLFDMATNEVGAVTYKVADNGSVTVKAVIEPTYDGDKKVAKKTISGTVAGGFAWDPETNRSGLGAALRSGTALWSCEVLFDNEDGEAKGAARYIRPDAADKTAVVDVDQLVD